MEVFGAAVHLWPGNYFLLSNRARMKVIFHPRSPSIMACFMLISTRAAPHNVNDYFELDFQSG